VPTRNLYLTGGRSMRAGSGICVFLSHRSADKHIAYALASAFDVCGIDYYLDANDDYLQAAAAEGDADRVVQAIERGIANSTHLLGIITPATRGSWWVPFEIGFSRATEHALNARWRNGDRPYDRTAYLVEPSVQDLPEFIKISTVISDQTALQRWLRVLLPGFGALPAALQDPKFLPTSRTMMFKPR
jgi:hypothetical protein